MDGVSLKLSSTRAIRRFGCLIVALYALLLLPGAHVLLHEHEASRLEQTQALRAALSLRAARVQHSHHVHDAPHHDSAHHDDLQSPPPSHRHSEQNGGSHG